jgi:hypothetical protein
MSTARVSQDGGYLHIASQSIDAPNRFDIKKEFSEKVTQRSEYTVPAGHLASMEQHASSCP